MKAEYTCPRCNNQYKKRKDFEAHLVMATDCIRFETKTVISDLIRKNFVSIHNQVEYVKDYIDLMKEVSVLPANKENLKKLKRLKTGTLNRISSGRRVINATRNLVKHHSEQIREDQLKIIEELLEDFSQELGKKLIEVV